MVDKDQIYVLSLPPDLAEQVNNGQGNFQSDVKFGQNGRQAHFHINGQVYRAKLKDNPTVLESMVSSDGETWFKSGDVSQIVKVYDKPIDTSHMTQKEIDDDLDAEWEESDEGAEARLWYELAYGRFGVKYNKYENLSGITPPTIMQKAFRFDSLPVRPEYSPDISERDLKLKYEMKLEENNDKNPKLSVLDKHKNQRTEKAPVKSARMTEINKKYYMDFYLVPMNKLKLTDSLMRSARLLNIDITSLLSSTTEDEFMDVEPMSQDSAYGQGSTDTQLSVPPQMTRQSTTNTGIFSNISSKQESDVMSPQDNLINDVNGITSGTEELNMNIPSQITRNRSARSFTSTSSDTNVDSTTQQRLGQSQDIFSGIQNKEYKRTSIFNLDMPTNRMDGTLASQVASPGPSLPASGYTSGLVSPVPEIRDTQSQLLSQGMPPLQSQQAVGQSQLQQNTSIFSPLANSQFPGLEMNMPPMPPTIEQPSTVSVAQSTQQISPSSMTQNLPQPNYPLTSQISSPQQIQYSQPPSLDARDSRIEDLRNEIGRLQKKIEGLRSKRISHLAIRMEVQKEIKEYETLILKYETDLKSLLSD